jgi:transmembrane sensor
MSSDPQTPVRTNASLPSDDARVPLIDWATQSGASSDVLCAIDRRLRRRTRRLRAMVAGGAIFAAVIFTWHSVATRQALPSAIAAGTLVVSVPSHQELPDGSTVDLKEGARISVDYSERLRRVTLLQGEAHFQVAKDPNKPFVVMARGIAVSAVGTAFSVQTSEATIEVLVTEGRVSVDHPIASVPEITGRAPAPEARPLALLDAGKRVVVDAAASSPQSPSVQTVSETELSARLAWRVPRLEFSGTSLREIVPAINRHSRARLVLADAALQDIRLSGRLRADDLETLLGLLEEGYGVRIERRSEREVVLHKSR